MLHCRSSKNVFALLLSTFILFSTVSCAVTPSETIPDGITEEQNILPPDSSTSGNENMQVPGQDLNTPAPLPSLDNIGVQDDGENAITDQFSGLMNADDHLIKDTEGNFTVPFDVAYPEAFDAGAFQYDPSVLLLKMDSEFDGQMTSELEACGFDALEEFCAVVSGTWYRATLSEGTVITASTKG